MHRVAAPKRVLWLMNAHRRDAAQADLHEAYEAAARCGGELVIRPFDVRSEQTLPDTAMRPRELRDLSGVVIYAVRPPRGLVADLLRRHVAFVLVNVTDDSVRTNCVLPDHAHGAFELCEHLIGLGHQQIRMVMGASEATEDPAAESGYRTSMRRHGLRPEPPVRLSMAIPPFVMPPPDKRPSAMLCVGADVAEAVRAAAEQAGLAVPGGISVAAVVGTEGSTAEARAVTSYEVAGFKVITWTFELLEKYAPGQKPQVILVPGRVIDRGSCGPPAHLEAITQPGDAVL
jgi:DNA-binding LacI/PurR family transcriptional regulator